MLFSVIRTRLDDDQGVVKEVIGKVQWADGQFEGRDLPEEAQIIVDSANAAEGWDTAAPPDRERDSVPVYERGSPKPRELAVQDLKSRMKRAGYYFVNEQDVPSDLNAT